MKLTTSTSFITIFPLFQSPKTPYHRFISRPVPFRSENTQPAQHDPSPSAADSYGRVSSVYVGTRASLGGLGAVLVAH